MPWVVLRFPESDTIEAVPAKWYDRVNQVCKFPPVDSHSDKELSNFIIDEYGPKEEWPTHEAVLESHTEFLNFNKAHIRAGKACSSQNYKSDKETVLPQKRTPKPRKIASSSSEHDSDGSDLVFENPFPKPRKEQYEKVTPSTSRTHLNFRSIVNKKEVKTVQVTPKPTASNDSAIETTLSYLIKIKRILELQEEKTNEIDRKIDELSTICKGQQKNADPSEITSDNDFNKKVPLFTISDVEELENHLQTTSNLDRFVLYIRQVGGLDYKESVRRSLRKIFKDELAVMYSFQGHKGKHSFNKTPICAAIIKSVLKQHPETTSKDVEVAISKWLAKAKERMKKRPTEENVLELEINN